MSYEDKRKAIQERSRQRIVNRAKVSKEFSHVIPVETSKLSLVQEHNTIILEASRKAYNQVKGKQVSFYLSKQEAKELKDYLEQALTNWNEWNSLDK